MKIGKLINKLIQTNIKIWHKDTSVRSGVDISLEQKADLYLKARELNAKRSEIRDDIDTHFGEESCSEKINYYRGKK